VNLKKLEEKMMFKNVYKFTLILILIFYLSASPALAYYNEDNGKPEYFITEDTLIESQLEDRITINEEGKIEIKIEKDQELDELLLKAKKRGLKIGLALGGGSARGLAHVGVIQVLEAYHIPIDIITGTSIGSVVGSLYAAGASIDQLEDAALSIKKSTTFFLMDPTIPHSGLISGKRIVKELNILGLEDKTFDTLNIPFAAVATDIKSGAKVILNQGNVIDAVRASISIPGVFTPVKYQDYYLVDGGVVDPVPVDVVQKMGADIIIAVSLVKINPYTPVLMIDKETGQLVEVENFDNLKIDNEKNIEFKDTKKITPSTDKEKSTLKQKIVRAKLKLKGPNIFEIISQTLDIMEAKITDQCLEGADVVIVPFGIKDINLFDFDKAEMLIKGGIMATMINIPEIKRAIKEKLRE
jgi:NTE family protein